MKDAAEDGDLMKRGGGEKKKGVRDRAREREKKRGKGRRKVHD